jgi:hypothetical protein
MATQQQISSTQIIQQSLKQEQPGADINLVLHVLADKVQKKEIKLLQIGNTVFMLKPIDGQTVEFHTFTIEPINDLILRYRAGINTLKEMGFKKAVSYSESPAFVKIAQQTGLPVRVSQEKTDKGVTYKFEVDL